MIFMNGKNNLESAALDNFRQLSEVGGNDRVNVVVELGRPESDRDKPGHTSAFGPWTGVLRFLVKRGTQPLPSEAVSPDDPTVRKADMGDAATLSSFVQWAKQKYPARKYALIIWNHGQGWRLELTNAERMRAARPLPLTPLGALGAPKGQFLERSLMGGFRSVSFDDDTQHALYNRDIQDKLGAAGLEIIGFDACFMGMIESGYAFRQLAKIMVASEELIPNAGWNYADWLPKLVKSPEMDGLALGRTLVESYAARYRNVNQNTTLSAVDLSGMAALARSVSSLAENLAARLPSSRPAIEQARGTASYGDWYSGASIMCNSEWVPAFHAVDLLKFVNMVAQLSSDPGVLEAARAVRRAIGRAVLYNYADSFEAATYGSTGMAIYFPMSSKLFGCDPNGSGYDPASVAAGQVESPPEFVQKDGKIWAEFLQQYLYRTP
jgi:cysteine peptidase C11 family protein